MWLGEFFPEEINVIPLFETKEAILNSAKILNIYRGGTLNISVFSWQGAILL